MTMIKLFKSIQGFCLFSSSEFLFILVSFLVSINFFFLSDVSYSIDAQAKLAHVSGKIDKELLLKLLAKAKTHVLTHQINYAFTKQAYISGKITPQLQFKLLAKAEAKAAARLCWLHYGYENDPYGRPIHKESEVNDQTSNNPSPSSKPKNSFCCLM